MITITIKWKVITRDSDGNYINDVNDAGRAESPG